MVPGHAGLSPSRTLIWACAWGMSQRGHPWDHFPSASERQPRVLLLAAKPVNLALPACPEGGSILRGWGAGCWFTAGLEGPFLPLWAQEYQIPSRHCPRCWALCSQPCLPPGTVPLPELSALHAAPPDATAPGTVCQAPLTRCWKEPHPSHLCPQAPSHPGGMGAVGVPAGKGGAGAW